MKITLITVGKKFTYNLGNYSNVQPELWISAEVDDADNVEEVRAKLAAIVDEHIHGEIDKALEEQGNAPKFYDGPRFDALEVVKEKYVVIVPHGAKATLPGAWPQARTTLSNHRLETVRKLCKEQHQDGTVADFSDGDFSDLPLLEHFFYAIANNPDFIGHYLLIAPGDIERSELSEEKGWDTWRVDTRFTDRFRPSFLAWAREEAEKHKLTLIDCLDGDLSRVPELRLKSETAKEEEMPFSYVEGEDDDEEWEDDEEPEEDEEEF